MAACKLAFRAGSLALLFLASTISAAEPSLTAREEVDHLLAYLQESNCRFVRNGEEFSAQDARDHLSKKYAYLLRKGLVKEAEDFVRLGASKSSSSGKPYQVRCVGKPAVLSETWLSEELARYRQQKSGAK
jgi:hypothetical protein